MKIFIKPKALSSDPGHFIFFQKLNTNKYIFSITFNYFKVDLDGGVNESHVMLIVHARILLNSTALSNLSISNIKHRIHPKICKFAFVNLGQLFITV